MTKSTKLTLDPGDIGDTTAVLYSKLQDGWDVVTNYSYSWDSSKLDLDTVLKEAGYDVNQVAGRKIVSKESSIYAHIFLRGVSVVGTPEGLSEFLNILESNPAAEEKMPDGVYRLDFQHMFINKFDDLDGITYNFDNTSEYLTSLQKELYPKVDAEKLMDLYTLSDESVLILTGEPGTGKTCFTKMLCKAMSEVKKKGLRITYVKDPEILKRDDFWITLQHREPDMLILDDLDDELKPRTEGRNTIMNHMLSFSDGIFPKKTKIVITTNQPNSAIDKAITRPGRCFDILSLPQLTFEEAKEIWCSSLDRDAETFSMTFGTGEAGGTISQAALMSEHKRLSVSERPCYLLDPSISIRTLVESGEVVNKE